MIATHNECKEDLLPRPDSGKINEKKGKGQNSSWSLKGVGEGRKGTEAFTESNK